MGGVHLDYVPDLLASQLTIILIAGLLHMPQARGSFSRVYCMVRGLADLHSVQVMLHMHTQDAPIMPTSNINIELP